MCKKDVEKLAPKIVGKINEDLINDIKFPKKNYDNMKVVRYVGGISENKENNILAVKEDTNSLKNCDRSTLIDQLDLGLKPDVNQNVTLNGSLPPPFKMFYGDKAFLFEIMAGDEEMMRISEEMGKTNRGSLYVPFEKCNLLLSSIKSMYTKFTHIK